VTLGARGKTSTALFVARDDKSELDAIGLVRDDRLFLALSDSDGGIVVYRFAGDGSARGEYTTYGSREELGEELLDGGPSGDLVGTYRWIANLPGATPTALGSGGHGNVDVRRTGETYHLDWHNGVTGVGLREGARLVVAWGSREPHEVAVLSPTADGLRGWIAGTSSPEVLPVKLTAKP
jgi:hypothetical protein